MKTSNALLSTSAAALMLLLLAGTPPSALADRGEGGWNNPPHSGGGPGNSGHWDNGPHGGPVDRGGGDHGSKGPDHDPRYRFDGRYHHDRYYPPHGFVVATLPHGYRAVPYHGRYYYYYGGVWYQPYGVSFVVVVPPIGIVVPVLPPFYTSIWVGGAPYYYANGVYYAWRPADNGYVVASAPPAPAVTTAPPTSQQLFIYPKNGQSEQQQANDRYDCHHWAASQTGFDPTQPVPNQSTEQVAAERTDYQRAMTACLEARGYSVK
jgi:hypothetical protein